MIALLLSIGLLLLPSALAQDDPDTLYLRLKQMAETELEALVTELAIENFTVGAYYDEEVKASFLDEDEDDDDEEIRIFEVDRDEPDRALQGRIPEICGDDKNLHSDCLIVRRNLEELAKRNGWLRQLGRDLQMIASGYESGVIGYSGMPVDVSTRMAGTAHFWRATNDPFIHPILESRGRAVSWKNQRQQIEEKMQELITGPLHDLIRTRLTADDKEKTDYTDYNAAMWRYSDGLYAVQQQDQVDCGDESSLEEAADPARLYLQRRWCEVETKLEEIHNFILSNVAIDPRPGINEQVVFPTYVDQEKNVMIWSRHDDIGLQFYIPIEPVLPAMYPPEFADCLETEDTKTCYDTHKDDLIRGGDYLVKLDGSGTLLRVPKEKEGICSHPFGKSGYLCRAMASEGCDVTDTVKGSYLEGNEDTDRSPGTGSIILTKCEPERYRDDVLRRISGSDLCTTGGWRNTSQENFSTVVDTPNIDPDMRPNQCSSCAIDVQCADTCNGQSDFALTLFYRHHGVIRICMPAAIEESGLAKYLLAHELVHAQQICNQSTIQSLERGGALDIERTVPDEFGVQPDYANAAACCAIEREAYFVQCKLMAQDGILEAAGVTIDQCASAYANFSCSAHVEDLPDGTPKFPDGNPCSNDGIDPGALAEHINNVYEQKASDLGIQSWSCSQLVSSPPTSIQSIYDSIPLVCRPGCETRYQNTIGNNLCYAAQCVEQAHEFHRDIPGRMPFITNDQDFPWDACEPNDPLIGELAVPPALIPPKLPPYQPAYLFKQLDDALCQANGLPARTPPILCAFQPLRRLNLQLEHIGLSVESLRLQPDEYDTTGLGMQFAAMAIGSRTSADVFTQYMRHGSRQFAELLDSVAIMFDALGEINFPSAMCPRRAGPGDMCRQLQ